MNRRDRRAIGLGGGVVLAAVLALRLAPWAIGAWSREQEHLDLARATLGRARWELRQLPAFEEAARPLTARVVALAPRILAERTPTGAQAEMAGVLEHLALVNHARLGRVEAVGDSLRAGELTRLTVDAVFETDIAGVTGLLATLDAMPLAIGPERLAISAEDPTVESRGPETLRVEVRLSAWYLVGRP